MNLLTWDNDCSEDIKRWMGKGRRALEGLTKIWRSKEISIMTKLWVLDVCVMIVLTYTAKVGTLDMEDMG